MSYSKTQITRNGADPRLSRSSGDPHPGVVRVLGLLAHAVPARGRRTFMGGSARWIVLAALTVVSFPLPASATFSIVARDPETGDIGVAVQSHYFSVGPIVPWAEPGVGAVATQSLVEVSYGPKGLELM